MNRFRHTSPVTAEHLMKDPKTNRVERVTITRDYPVSWKVQNVDFGEETPECMKFTYGMVKSRCQVYDLPPDKMEVAKEHLQVLQTFDPQHEYTISERMQTITKKPRLPIPLDGELAELEDYFITNVDCAKGQRPYVRQMFDDLKYGFVDSDKVIHQLRTIIKPQQRLF